MPHPAPTLIALDQGTTHARAALYRAGRLVTEARRDVALIFPAPGHAEQDPRELADAALATVEEVAGRLEPGETATLGITNQRSTLVPWDAETGRALGPALSWRDSRARAESAAFAAAVPDLAARTGLPASPHYGAPKIAWMLRHSPAVAEANRRGTLRVGPVSSWLVAQLTHGASFTVDPTNAQRLLLMDLCRLEWDAELLAAIGLGEASLPAILPTDGYFGEAQVGGRRLSVRAMLGDQQAALIGHEAGGNSDPQVVRVHLGTGGFVLRDVGETCLPVQGLLAGVARADANSARRYLVEGTVNSVGSAFDRLRDLGFLQDGETVDQLCQQSSEPATVVPAWAGLGSPWWEAGARAAILEWDESGTRADVVAGTVRGIAFLVADIVDALRSAGLVVKRLDLSGPVSRVGALVQAITDATGCAAQVRTNPEASLEGIATLLAHACGSTAPFPSVDHEAEVAPCHDLSVARRSFDAARALAVQLARSRA